MRNLLLILNLAGLLLIVFAIFRFMADFTTGIFLLLSGILLFVGSEIAKKFWHK